MSEENKVLDGADQAAVDAAAEPQQNQPAGGSAAPREKLWTQSEVDAYVKARIDKQNAKHRTEDAEKDARIAELEETSKAASAEAEQLKAEKQLAEWADQVSRETGIPSAVIRGNSLEEMQQHAEAIKATMSLYPTVGDTNKPASKPMTLDDIRAIEDPKERRAALIAHPELYADS